MGRRWDGAEGGRGDGLGERRRDADREGRLTAPARDSRPMSLAGRHRFSLSSRQGSPSTGTSKGSQMAARKSASAPRFICSCPCISTASEIMRVVQTVSVSALNIISLNRSTCLDDRSPKLLARCRLYSLRVSSVVSSLSKRSGGTAINSELVLDGALERPLPIHASCVASTDALSRCP